MIRFLAALLLVAFAPPAWAADRTYPISSFDRVRIDGPFEVHLVSGKSAAARVSTDPDTLERVTIAVDGTTLTVRLGGQGWAERPSTRQAPLVVTLATPQLRIAQVNAGGRLTIAGVKGQRIELSVSGSGTIAATGIAADQLNATIVGTGSMTLAGTALRARLLANGPAAIDAGALSVGELAIRLDGSGTIKADARYTANVLSTGLGSVTVTGSPTCTVNRGAPGPVLCGRSQQP